MFFTRTAVLALVVYSAFHTGFLLIAIIAFAVAQIDWIIIQEQFRRQKTEVKVIEYKDSPQQQNKINELEGKLAAAKTSVQSQLTAQSSQITNLISRNASLSTTVEKQKLEIEELRKINEPS